MFRFILGALIVLTACGKDPVPISQPLVVPDQLSLLVFEGEARDAFPTVDGYSVFDPVWDTAVVPPVSQVEQLVSFAGHQLHLWDLDPDLSLSAYLHGFGAGSSSDISRILVAMATERGISGRLVEVAGHTAAELRFKERWHMVDVRFGLFPIAISRQPISLESLRADPDLIPPGIGSTGYDPSFPREVYTSGEPRYEPERARIARPRWNIESGQEWVIQPRPSDSPYSLPLPRQKERDHVLPLYHLSVKQRFSGEAVTLETGLPILSLSFDGILEIHKNKVVHLAQDPEQLTTMVYGQTGPVTFQMKEGAVLEVVYALAGWIGDRMFTAGSELVMKGRSGHISIQAKPKGRQMKVAFSPLQTGRNDDGSIWVRSTVSWSQVHQDHLVRYEIALDELASSLPGEWLQTIDRRVWSWNPENMNAFGQEILEWRWEPGTSASPFRRPSRRTLLLHVRGVGLSTKENSRLAHLDISDSREF